MTICADDYNGDRCKHQAEETCDVCSREFCWEHLLNVDVTIGVAMGEERVMCRECVTQDVRMLQALFAELEDQLKQAKR
jgi:hypothetical protein